MYDKNILGTVIKARREKAGLSQKELGELIGMSQQQLSQYESGTRRPKLETVSKMAKALNMSDDEFMPAAVDCIDFSEIVLPEKAYALLIGMLGLYGYDLPLDAKGIVIKVL